MIRKNARRMTSRAKVGRDGAICYGASQWPSNSASGHSIAKGRTSESESPQRSPSARQCSLRCERSDSEGGRRRTRSKLPARDNPARRASIGTGRRAPASRTGPGPPVPPEQGHRSPAPAQPNPASAAPGRKLSCQRSPRILPVQRMQARRRAAASPGRSGPVQPLTSTTW